MLPLSGRSSGHELYFLFIFDFSHNLTVDQCTFKNNYGSYWEGGAIFKSDGYISILNSCFSHNKDVSQGGAVSIMI